MIKSIIISALSLIAIQTGFADDPNAKFAERNTNSSINAKSLPYMNSSQGREGYEFAGEETNTYRIYDFYKRQAKFHTKANDSLSLLPAYPDLDGGEFGHWGKYNENGHKDTRWDIMDYGPAMTASYAVDTKKKIGSNVNIILQSGQTVTFSKKAASYYNAWDGRPVFDPHRWGLIRGAGPNKGVQTTDLSSWFTAISKDGKTMSRYLGHFVYGKRAIMQYKIDKTHFYDSASRMENGCYTRTIIASQSETIELPFNLKSLKGWDVKTTGNILVAQKDAKTIVAAAKSFANGKGSLLKPSTKNSSWSATADGFKLYLWEGTVAKASQAISAITQDQHIDSLQKWAKGGPANWPQLFKEKITLAKDDKPYVIDRIGVPVKNPWGSMMLLSGIDFDKDGVAYISTMMGDVWKVTGLGEGMTEATWKRYAAGLDQPFGLRVVNDLPYVLTRGNIICLRDLNGDNEADFYETYYSFDYAPTGHTGTFGLHLDKDNTFYFVNGGSAHKKPWNKPGELLASGLRNAMAVGASRDGLFLVGPQEGIWTPSSSVLEIQKGDYYGMGAKISKTGERLGTKGHDITPSLAYLPRGIDNSTGGFEFPVSDRFGPLSEKILGLSYGYGSWFQILRNDNYKDHDRAQGAIVPLPGEFRAGAAHSKINPADGMLYVVGLDGWGNYSLDDGSLERVRYTGKALPMLEQVHGYENGIELQFSSKLTGNALTVAKNYFVQQWNYEYSPAYGSLEYSVRQPRQEGHDRLQVSNAKLLPDGKSIFLEIPDILPAMQTHIYGEFATTEGTVEVNTFATLLHLDKAKEGFAVPAHKIRTAEIRMRSKNIDGKSAAKAAFTVPARIEAGKILFKQFCMGCHGPEGKGLPNIAPTLHSDWVAGSTDVLTKVLLKGLKGDITINGKVQHFEAAMPAFGDALGDNEIAAILTFLRKTWAKGKSAVSKESVAAVRAAVKDQKLPYEASDLWKGTKKNDADIGANPDSAWKALFDGKTFEGWQQLGGKHKFEIIDQMIIGTSVAKEGNAFMTTKKKYKNFELKFEVKVDYPLNSGCQIRSVPQGPHGGLKGPQVEIAYGKAGMIYGELMKTKDGQRRGWLSPDLESAKREPKKSALKKEQWNSYRIVVQDNRYQTFINGILITDFTTDEITVAGHIGLQVHKVKDKDVGKVVRWRNIFIKTLSNN